MLYVIDNNKLGFETNYWFLETDVDQTILAGIFSMPEQGHSVVFTCEQVKWFEGDPVSLEEYVQDFEFAGHELELADIEEIKLAVRKDILKEAVEETRDEVTAMKETLSEYELEAQAEIEKQIEEMTNLVGQYEAKLKAL